MRRAQNADTHALKQHRLSQNIFPVCSSFVLVIASDMHLEPEKRAQNVHFHTTKNIQIQSTLFRYFLDEFLYTDLRPIYCSLTCFLPMHRFHHGSLCLSEITHLAFLFRKGHGVVTLVR